MASAVQKPAPGVCDPQAPIPSGYEPIHPAVLRRLNRWDVDLFVLGRPGEAPVLFREAGYEFKDSRVERLLQTLDRRVLVRAKDYQGLSEQLLRDLEVIPDSVHMPDSDRFALLQTAAAAAIESSLSLMDPSRFLEVATQIGGYFTRLVETSDLSVADVFLIARHDQSTFTHVTNVCCYALILAEQLGVTSKEQLDDIALGALVHDIGKRHIPKEIIKRPAALTPAETELVRRHPQMGYEELLCNSQLSLPQMLMAYQHHEHVDGGGYPVGSVREEIHPWSRLLAVVDVFDSLTGRRPYRPPFTPRDAMRHLEERAGTQFEEEVVRCWRQMFQLG